MPTVPFQTSSTSVELKPAPIMPNWVVDGHPVARAAELSRSPDGTAFTVVWQCTPGTFDWTYHCDETIHILEGSIVLSDDGNAARRLGPGDVVFFPKGAQVRWTVETTVKKVAFFRAALPNPLAPAYKQLRRLKRWLVGAPGGTDVMGVGAGPVRSTVRS